ncbi:MAG: thioredoxin [Opitutae bacterium]|nr:thioredoxin [Opitutae bacterium]MBC9890492.1 thioredoxin [Opitutae bacterium]
MSDKISTLTTDSFDRAIEGTPTAVVDFWAPWCSPCRTMGAILENLAEEVDDSTRIFKVDVDENGPLAGKYGIRSIPTLLIFKDGNLAHTVVGVTQKEALKAKLG